MPRTVTAPAHHDAMRRGLGARTTIDLPDDLHKQAQAIARDTHRTLSETVAELIRRGLGAGSTTAISTDPTTGLPLVSAQLPKQPVLRWGLPAIDGGVVVTPVVNTQASSVRCRS